MLTLYITPVVYVYMDKLQTWRKAKKPRRSVVVSAEEPLAEALR